MKLFTVSSLGLLVSSTAAFPAGMDAFTAPLKANLVDRMEARHREAEALETRQDRLAPQGAGALPYAPPPFDAKAQYVSNQGDNQFIAPGPNDERGPCPGLNAMANHGYLPRNGRATIEQFTSGTRQVFGMAPDLGGFLARFGAIVDGDGSSWSIGGTVRTGIGGSHGNYETDSSPLRADLNQYGSNGELIMSQFYNLYNRQPNSPSANYNLEVLRAFRGSRFNESIAKNPFFVYNPFAGIEVSQAAFTFIYRFMSNKSATYPSGTLNRNVLKSFMSIQGPENNLRWVPGNERIPDNWYKRNQADEYSIPYFQSDILYFASAIPQILTTGCNQGRVNTYTSFNPLALSNGAYDQNAVAQKPLCFSNEFTKASLSSLTGLPLTDSRLAPLVSALTTADAGMDCSSISSVNVTALSVCPGLSLYGGPTGPVAPGAIQTR